MTDKVEFDIYENEGEKEENQIIYTIRSKGLQIGTLAIDLPTKGMNAIHAKTIILKKI